MTVDDFVTRVEVAIGVTMENVANYAGEFGVAKIFGDLFISSDLAFRNHSQELINAFGVKICFHGAFAIVSARWR